MIWSSKPRAALGFAPFDPPHFMDADIHGALPPLPEAHKPGPYPCQLAGEYDPDRFPEHGAIVDEKIDGIRAYSLACEPPMSRQENTLQFGWWLSAPLSVLSERLGPGDWFIDGELTSGPTLETTLAAHKRGEMDPAAVLHVFDAIPAEQWRSGAPGEELHERKRRLRAAFDQGPIDGLALVPSWECAMAAYVRIIAERIWERGGEGVIVKDRRGRYVRSRSMQWGKLKREQTYSVQITGWRPMRFKPGREPDDGLPRLGALLGYHNGKRCSIYTGTGWTDAERRRMAGHADTFKGRIAEVAAMNRADNGALRSARFRRWRNEGEG